MAGVDGRVMGFVAAVRGVMIGSSVEATGRMVGEVW